jgi:hypothetical protein
MTHNMCKYVVPTPMDALLLMPCGYQDQLMGEYKIKYAMIQIINIFVIDSYVIFNVYR